MSKPLTVGEVRALLDKGHFQDDALFPLFLTADNLSDLKVHRRLYLYAVSTLIEGVPGPATMHFKLKEPA